MFCSIRNGANAPTTAANGVKASLTSASTKWHRGLLSGGTPSAASCGGGGGAPGGMGGGGGGGSGGGSNSGGYGSGGGLHSKNSGEWKAPASFWKYLVKYRRHFRMPLIISVLAVLVNIPAFFEIVAVPCYFFPEYRVIYRLYVSYFRLNDYYKFWYRMVFRMLVTTCGPNIFILCLTVITVLLLRGTNRSRQRLFHMNEVAIEQYSSRAKMLTTISICLAVKFLLLRSLTFVLDIWEVAYGFKKEVHRYLYVVDVSNFLIILNSSTNCLIIYGFSRWLHNKISNRNIVKREKQHCLNNVNTKRRTMLLYDSWLKALKLTHRQFGNRVLYAMLLKNPQMFTPFRDNDAASSASASAKQSVASASLSAAGDAAATAAGAPAAATNGADAVKLRETPAASADAKAARDKAMKLRCIRYARPTVADKTVLDTSATPDAVIGGNSNEDTVVNCQLANSALPNSISNRNTTNVARRLSLNSPQQQPQQQQPQQQMCDRELEHICENKIPQTAPPPIAASAELATAAADSANPAANDTIALGVPKLLPSITITTPLLDSRANEEWERGDDHSRYSAGGVANGSAVTAKCPRIVVVDDKSGGSSSAPATTMSNGGVAAADALPSPPTVAPKIIDVEAAAAATLSVIPKRKKRSIDLLMNARFHEFGEQIVQFFDELIETMQQTANYEQAVMAKIQHTGKIHHENGIVFTASAWKEFKSSALSIIADCEYDSEADRVETLEAWSSFLSVIIHNMKLGMWNSNNYNNYACNNNNINNNYNNNSMQKQFRGANCQRRFSP